MFPKTQRFRPVSPLLLMTIAYLFIFPSFLILRYKYPNVPRVYRVPGGMPGAWIVTLLAFAYALVAVVFLLVPGSTGKVDRLTYELTEFIPLRFVRVAPSQKS